jgi:hypothetical protein
MRIDRRNVPALLCGCALLGALAPVAIAHFRLLAPASWIEEGQYGDPQWLAPCGGTAKDPGKPTGALTKVQGGEKLHIRIREMAYHPGFYRVVWHGGEVHFRCDSLSSAAARSRRRPLPAYRSVRYGTGGRRTHPEYQLLQMHPAGDRIHGGPFPQQRGRLLLPPLRRASGTGESESADRYPVSGREEVASADRCHMSKSKILIVLMSQPEPEVAYAGPASASRRSLLVAQG